MKERLDKAVVGRGLAGSRERARSLILGGKVLVDDRPVTKAGALVADSCVIRLKGEDMPFVSRGGVKLDAALEHFGVELRGALCMDVGASTGGFTHVMLLRGARCVLSVDVGYGQFDWGLRNDPRVVLMERTNIRHLELEAVPEPVDFAAVDVSFISLRLVLPRVAAFVRPGGGVLALVKPQFEVGRGEVGKGGIVREEAKRLAAVEDVKESARAAGFETRGMMESPIRGQKGNIEYILHLKRA